MALTAQIGHHVDRRVRNRGRSYYTRGAVRITSGDASQVTAEVRGSRNYSVALERLSDTLQVSCDCPYFVGTVETCKHIWAAVLAADRAGYLQAPSKTPVRQLVQRGDTMDSAEEAAETVEWPDHDDGGLEDSPKDWVGRWLRRKKRRGQKKKPKADAAPDWKRQLANVRREKESDRHSVSPRWSLAREIVYVIDLASCKAERQIVVEVAYRERKKNGEWSKPKLDKISRDDISKVPNPADREILTLMAGAKQGGDYSYGYYYPGYDTCRYQLSGVIAHMLLPRMCATGRCFLRLDSAERPLQPLEWDNGEPWRFWLEVTAEEASPIYRITGSLRRDETRVELSKPAMVWTNTVLFAGGLARLEDFGASNWLAALRKRNFLQVPVADGDQLIAELLKFPTLPRLDLPKELQYEEVACPPEFRIKIRPPELGNWGAARLRGELSFIYEGHTVRADESSIGIYEAERRRLLKRDPQAEAAARARLNQAGFQANRYQDQLELPPKSLPGVVRSLLSEGWHVEAEGKLYRRPGELNVNVTSGIDWFELHGQVDFGGVTARLPELLAALRRGEDTVRLDDGTFGILPESWLKKYGLVAGLGKAEQGHVRFEKHQVGLLDALLLAQPEATCDATFEQARQQLRRFDGIESVEPSPGFRGTLRAYQRDGLGWLRFLADFGFGGCLADDMGLGKTVQVLALLEGRRTVRADAAAGGNGDGWRPGPSLVVVPKSLVFNWKQEAERFAPQLRVLDHTGLGRSKDAACFADYDLVVTTYGVLLRDFAQFKEVVFDYCILDEAQAIKNAQTQCAKAVRVLQANHRLALSGTPIQNHLGELWSLFEFLNPGMLGSASVFRLGAAGSRNPDEESRQLLSRGLRPFILRRTKDQVAKDLPQKTEQTVYCELEPAERKRYDDLREYYRQALLARIDREGMNKNKIMILEALLRLRQAACHVGLLDKQKTGESSAKLETLLAQLDEVLDEGHKALVFSQFTSLLAIVRQRLDKKQIPYEYLDGRTRDRAERVEHFQNDPSCKLFLISLKAGGLGLNLTAAEYVFLLDPWWNPAVEAQAIDRTHRIGQSCPVFAYRLLARDTVEERVLELQQSKRNLADAIINADNSLIRNLGREDLELLLS